MIRKYRWKILISSLLILFPPALSLFLLTSPEIGPDLSMNRLKILLWMPAVMLAAHLIGIWFCLHDPKNREQHPAVLDFIFWICPLASVSAWAAAYQVTAGRFNDGPFVTFLAVGMMFLAMGNYMPKISPNQTLGIRVPWTLWDEENWKATHRMSGRVWVICGCLVLAGCFLPWEIGKYLMAPAILTAAFIPIAYSYLFYRRKKKRGEPVRDPSKTVFQSPRQQTAARVSVAVTVLIVAFIVVTLFVGDLHFRYGEESFTVHSVYWPDLNVRYDEIESMEYRQVDSPGTRTNGYGSMRLLMGDFRNREFGSYLRYSYTGHGPCIVLKVNGETIVVGGKDESDTRAVYEELTAHTGGT